jgi:TonB family protein
MKGSPIKVLSVALLLCALVLAQSVPSLPAGTRLRVQMQNSIETKTSHVGDVAEAVLIEQGNTAVPVGTRLHGRVVAVSAENKKQQAHARLQLSFEELLLPDGRKITAQASIQSLGINEQVDSDGVATIHPLSHDFALKSGRKLWLRINANSLTSPGVVASDPAPTQAVPQSRPRDTSKTSARLGDLQITLNEIENPAIHPRYGNREDRHEVLIKGIVKNVGKNPVCAYINAKLETSFKLEESTTTTLAGHDFGSISELLPTEQLDAAFTASVKNGTDPLKLTISQSQPEQGCGENSHHLFFNTDVTIPVTSLPPATISSLGTGEGGGVFQVGGSVSPPRVVHKTEPDFPEETRKAGHQGTVVIRAVIGQDGSVHDPRVVRSLGWGLDEKALEAVRHWTFTPATKDGRKVAVYVDIEVNFRLY